MLKSLCTISGQDEQSCIQMIKSDNSELSNTLKALYKEDKEACKAINNTLESKGYAINFKQGLIFKFQALFDCK